MGLSEIRVTQDFMTVALVGHDVSAMLEGDNLGAILDSAGNGPGEPAYPSNGVTTHIISQEVDLN